MKEKDFEAKVDRSLKRSNYMKKKKRIERIKTIKPVQWMKKISK